jgi:hypothetical protein
MHTRRSTEEQPMKTLLVALAFALVALPATVNAQD